MGGGGGGKGERLVLSTRHINEIYYMLRKNVLYICHRNSLAGIFAAFYSRLLLFLLFAI